MEFKKIPYSYASYTATTDSSIEIPFLCPNCGVSNNPSNNLLILHSETLFFAHYCTACNKEHYSIQQTSADKIYYIASLYPNQQPTDLPKLVVEHFPRFSKMYGDAEQAEQYGATDLAGIGYRASLEILIKDYALEFELDPKESIAKLNLNNAIAHYFKDNNPIFNTAEVVRILGNDYTHWEQVETVGLETMKSYLDIFISYIKTQLMMKYPPVSR